MTNRSLLSVLALLALGTPAMAQESGGVPLSPNLKGGGPVGLARPVPHTFAPMLSAHDAQNGMTAADHQAQNQNTITNLRGDAGFLAGFSFGTPLAASRQPAQTLPDDGGFEYRRHHHGNGSSPIIINNQGPLALTVGNGNVIQQQSANGSGPIAQQQVSTTPTHAVTGGAISGGITPSGITQGGGALNLVSGSGNIIQRAPGH